ncbi:hypothetical protein GCM10027289_24190 [Tsukamurella serpentis]
MSSDSTKTIKHTVRAALGVTLAVTGLVAAPAVAQAAPAPQAPVGAQQAGPDRSAVAKAALTRLGMPYSYGASGPGSFDCSGLVSWAMNQSGISVPRSSYALMNAGTPVSRADLRPGDVVITNGGGHAAVYVGNGQVVEAVMSGVPVRVGSIRGFVTARRF